MERENGMEEREQSGGNEEEKKISRRHREKMEDRGRKERRRETQRMTILIYFQSLMNGNKIGGRCGANKKRPYIRPHQPDASSTLLVLFTEVSWRGEE